MASATKVVHLYRILREKLRKSTASWYSISLSTSDDRKRLKLRISKHCITDCSHHQNLHYQGQTEDIRLTTTRVTSKCGGPCLRSILNEQKTLSFWSTFLNEPKRAYHKTHRKGLTDVLDILMLFCISEGRGLVSERTMTRSSGY